jgi:hypothetical protein
VHSPGEEHETLSRLALGSGVEAFEGLVISIAGDQDPFDSVAAMTSWLLEVSKYSPTAVQLPGEEQEIPLSKT